MNLLIKSLIAAADIVLAVIVTIAIKEMVDEGEDCGGYTKKVGFTISFILFVSAVITISM